MLTGAMDGILRQRGDVDVDRVLPVARKLLERAPAHVQRAARPSWPSASPSSTSARSATRCGCSCRSLMVPSDDRWSFPADAPFALAERWLARAARRRGPPRRSSAATSAAFGPAERRRRAGVVRAEGPQGRRRRAWRDELVAFTSTAGRRTLYDLPDAPRPDEDAPAPPRLLPEFDSLLLAHQDRTRVIDDERRKALATKNLRVQATFLVDGFVAGSWAIERKRGTATLTLVGVRAARRSRSKDELAAEAEGLLALPRGRRDAARRVRSAVGGGAAREQRRRGERRQQPGGHARVAGQHEVADRDGQRARATARRRRRARRAATRRERPRRAGGRRARAPAPRARAAPRRAALATRPPPPRRRPRRGRRAPRCCARARAAAAGSRTRPPRSARRASRSGSRRRAWWASCSITARSSGSPSRASARVGHVERRPQQPGAERERPASRTTVTACPATSRRPTTGRARSTALRARLAPQRRAEPPQDERVGERERGERDVVVPGRRVAAGEQRRQRGSARRRARRSARSARRCPRAARARAPAAAPPTPVIPRPAGAARRAAADRAPPCAGRTGRAPARRTARAAPRPRRPRARRGTPRATARR